MGDGYMSIKEMELETKLAHGCHTPDSETRSLTSPIYQTATYGAVSQENLRICVTTGGTFMPENQILQLMNLQELLP